MDSFLILSFDPLPHLPPRGKEFISFAPLGETGKGVEAKKEFRFNS
jgi:hypothetical protein